MVNLNYALACFSKQYVEGVDNSSGLQPPANVRLFLYAKALERSGRRKPLPPLTTSAPLLPPDAKFQTQWRSPNASGVSPLRDVLNPPPPPPTPPPPPDDVRSREKKAMPLAETLGTEDLLAKAENLSRDAATKPCGVDRVVSSNPQMRSYLLSDGSINDAVSRTAIAALKTSFGTLN